MTFGCDFDLFFSRFKDLSNKDKIDKLRKYSTGDMLTLLRNIEESPREYDEEIIKAVYSSLYDKGIICI
ncbi:MAG: hypothetical protein GX660_02800 [Clostridiaceae bacterium]|jgi:hypothetical protein|nr:hypothetical protein [Clostridiaceae bacterium]